jgi:hypothetical protein
MERSEVRRVFSCFILVLIAMFFLCGCSTTRWEWAPEDSKFPTRLTKGEKERGVVKVDILKVSF